MNLLSPGVAVQEYDFSTVVRQSGTSTGAFAGNASDGPIGEITVITDEGQYVNLFGKPDNTNFEDFMSVSSFLAYTDDLRFSRVASRKTYNATSSEDDGSDAEQMSLTPVITEGKIVAISVPSDASWNVDLDEENTFITIENTDTGIGHGAKAVPVFVNGIITEVKVLSGGSDYTKETVEVNAVTGIQIKNESDYEYRFMHTNSLKTETIPEFYEVSIDSEGKTVYTKHESGTLNVPRFGNFASKYAGKKGNGLRIEIFDSNSEEEFETWAYAKYFSQAPSTSDYVANLGGSNDEFHIVIIDGEGVYSGTKDEVLAFFPFVSKAIDAVNASGDSTYWRKVLANSKYAYALCPPDYNELIELKFVDDKVGSVNVMNAGSGYTTVPEIVFSAPEGGTAAKATLSTTNGAITGVTITNYGSGYTDAPTVTISAPYDPAGEQAEITFTVEQGAITDKYTIVKGGSGYSTTPVITIDGNASVTASVSDGSISGVIIVDEGSGYTEAPTVTISAPYSLNGQRAVLNAQLKDVETVTPYKDTKNWDSPAQGVNFGRTINPVTSFELSGRKYEKPSDADYMDAWDMFKDADEIDVSLLFTGACSQTVLNYLMSNIVTDVSSATGRAGTSMLFFSPPKELCVNNNGQEASDIVAWAKSLPHSNYFVCDCNWKYMYDRYNEIYRWIPCNADIAGLCAYTDNTRDAWWSPAGLNRGRIKNAIKLAWNPKRTERDMLYLQSVNSVISMSGEGILLYGDKTFTLKPSAFDRINVRRLFIVLEKSIAQSAKYMLFEFNDSVTRAMFVSMVDPFLRNIQGRRGIDSYRVVCDESNNTPYVIDNNQFVASIMVRPLYSINYIYLNFAVVGNSVSFDEVVM